MFPTHRQKIRAESNDLTDKFVSYCMAIENTRLSSIMCAIAEFAASGWNVHFGENVVSSIGMEITSA